VEPGRLVEEAALEPRVSARGAGNERRWNSRRLRRARHARTLRRRRPARREQEEILRNPVERRRGVTQRDPLPHGSFDQLFLHKEVPPARSAEHLPDPRARLGAHAGPGLAEDPAGLRGAARSGPRITDERVPRQQIGGAGVALLAVTPDVGPRQEEPVALLLGDEVGRHPHLPALDQPLRVRAVPARRAVEGPEEGANDSSRETAACTVGA